MRADANYWISGWIIRIIAVENLPANQILIKLRPAPAQVKIAGQAQKFLLHRRMYEVLAVKHPVERPPHLFLSGRMNLTRLIRILTHRLTRLILRGARQCMGAVDLRCHFLNPRFFLTVDC